MAKKKQGFAGERQIVLSKSFLKSYLAQQISFKHNYFLQAGFYPDAKYQYLENLNGDENYQIIYCIKGYGSASVNYKSYYLSVGDFLIIPANIPFSYQADVLKPWSFYSFKFNGLLYQEMINQYLKQNNQLKNYLPYTDEKIRLFGQISNHLNHGISYANLNLINVALIQFISSLTTLLHQNNKVKTDNNKNILNESVKFLNENYHLNLNLDIISKQAGLSVSHYSKLFKSETGVSPINYVINLKVKKACEYLQFTNLLVKQIAFKVGIQDIYYFTKIFKANVGLSPNQYRKSIS
jgi:AraC-like DNA-binding protein